MLHAAINHMGNSSYSTVGFVDRSVEQALAAIAAAGFPQAEILGQEPHVAVPLTGQALSEFRRLLEDLGVRARTIHAPMMHNVLGAPEENWRREKVGVLGTYVQFAGALGASDIIMHPVPNPGFVPNADDPAIPGLIRDAVPRSLDELIPVAEEAGVRILLENLPYDCDYPLQTMQELRPLVDGYPEDCLGLVLDTGHAWTLKKDPVLEIHAAGPRLGQSLGTNARRAGLEGHSTRFVRGAICGGLDIRSGLCASRGESRGFGAHHSRSGPGMGPVAS